MAAPANDRCVFIAVYRGFCAKAIFSMQSSYLSVRNLRKKADSSRQLMSRERLRPKLQSTVSGSTRPETCSPR
jgi:hypothetical protein